MLTRWVGGSRNGPKYAYVIFEWSQKEMFKNANPVENTKVDETMMQQICNMWNNFKNPLSQLSMTSHNSLGNHLKGPWISSFVQYFAKIVKCLQNAMLNISCIYVISQKYFHGQIYKYQIQSFKVRFCHILKKGLQN